MNNNSFTDLKYGDTVYVHNSIEGTTDVGIVLSIAAGFDSMRPTIFVGWFKGASSEAKAMTFYADNGIEYSYGENDIVAKRIVKRNSIAL